MMDESNCCEDDCSKCTGQIKTDATSTNAYLSYNEAQPLDMDKWKDKFPKGYMDYRKRWEENPVRQLIEKGPLHVVLEITTVCNLRCEFCTRTIMLNDGTFNRPIKHMDESLWKKAIDEMSELGVPSLALNGWGEPVLYPKLPEVISYAKKKGIIDVLFHSNASLMTDEMAKSIIKAGVDKIIFSIDAPDKEMYEKRRVGDNVSYEEVEKRILRFIKLRDENGKDFPIIRVTMSLTPDMPTEVADNFVSKWKGKADIISFQQYFKPPRQDEEYPVSTYNKNFNCPQLYHRIFVTVDGIVVPCCGDSAYKEMVIGDLTRETIGQIWNGKRLNRIRDVVRNGNYHKLPACRKCIRPLDVNFHTKRINTAPTNYSKS